jgi:hypothetical protein
MAVRKTRHMRVRLDFVLTFDRELDSCVNLYGNDEQVLVPVRR